MTIKHVVRLAFGVACLALVVCVVKAQSPVSKIQRIPIPNSDFPISLDPSKDNKMDFAGQNPNVDLRLCSRAVSSPA